jgi:DNA (cytosine-5)-methyltransferase 1
MLKVRTLFSGIGSPEIALRDLHIPFELVDFCEVDKYAVQSYCAVHGVDPSKNLGDITRVWGRNLPYADLLVWGFPCTDISVAGKQAGIVEGETRSGLYYEGLRILRETKPKYSIIENVKNLTGKKFKAEFEQMLADIKELGYNNYHKVLNAKDYGIPQNRERVFIISIRADVDKGYEFPIGFDNGLRLKDFLEDEVDEKYYISQEKVEHMISKINYGNKGILPDFKGDVLASYNLSSKEHRTVGWKDNVNALCARDYKDQKVVCVPYIEPNVMRFERTEYGKEIRKEYELGLVDEKIGNMRIPTPRTDGIANTLTTVLKDNMLCVPCITPDRVEKRQNGRRFKEDGDPSFTLTSQDRHGILQIGSFDKEDINDNERQRRVYSDEGISPTVLARTDNAKVLQIGELDIKGMDCIKRVYSDKGISPTLTTMEGGNRQPKVLLNYRIRKLTPKECWRLMGFTDEDYQKAVDAGVSNSQLYKQAGNSIVSTVLAAIFKNLLQAEIAQIYEDNKQLS